eukprot:9605045-Heterocapsa_arctica.AAC.1
MRSIGGEATEQQQIMWSMIRYSERARTSRRIRKIIHRNTTIKATNDTQGESGGENNDEERKVKDTKKEQQRMRHRGKHRRIINNSRGAEQKKHIIMGSRGEGENAEEEKEKTRST